MRLCSAFVLLPLLTNARVSQDSHRRATSASRLDLKAHLSADEPTHALGERTFGAAIPAEVPSTSVALGTNICLSVQQATTVTWDGSAVNLKADTCVCIDGTLYLKATFHGATPQVSLQLDGAIQSATQADGQVALSSSVPATSIARTGAAGLGVGICYQVALAVNDPFSVHDFSNVHRDGCCKRKGYMQCGSTCINKVDYTCVSGVPKSAKGKRDLACASNMTRWPVGPTGWECIDTMTDIESCGGCLHPGHNATAPGFDCTMVPHVGHVACERGECKIKSCQRGFVPDSKGTGCGSRTGQAGLAVSGKGTSWPGFTIQNRGL